MSSSGKGGKGSKGKGGTSETSQGNDPDGLRGWTWEEGETFAKELQEQTEKLAAATPKMIPCKPPASEPPTGHGQEPSEKSNAAAAATS